MEYTQVPVYYIWIQNSFNF